jgi:sirohydrochlorin cobaltochelatase
MKQAIILFAHGSRDPQWRRPMESVADRLTRLAPQALVRCAYLELTEPDLPAAAADLVRLGAGEVTIVPMFLGAGRHVREDLPALVEDLRVRHPAVRWMLQPPVGESERLLDLLAELACPTVRPRVTDSPP